MARSPNDRQRVEALLDRYSPEIRRAFLEAIDDIKSQAELTRLIEALERRNITAALAAIHMEPAAFRRMERLIGDAFEAGGAEMIKVLPTLRDADGARVGVRFDPGHPRAAAWVSNHGATLVTNIVEDQMTAIRGAISRGLELGKGSRSMALDIVGRVDRRTGRRSGGIVGLTSAQVDMVAKVDEMLTDPDRIRGFFIRDQKTGEWKPRYVTTPRTYDRKIRRAIEAGEALDRATVTRVITGTENRMLALRGETIGRTESLMAVSEARDEAVRQTVEDAGIDEALVERTWRATHDHRTRDTHRAMDGQTVDGLNTPFLSPSGAQLRHPGDPDAPGEEIIDCRCVATVRIRRPARSS